MIPEENWTKNQREFVGSTFPTPKGGVLTVTGVAETKPCKGKRNANVFYLVKCSICSEDSEVFPKGVFTSTKANLLNGCSPCGCTGLKTLTKEQKLILMNRDLQTKNPNIKALDIAGRNNEERYILECSVCSSDNELFPYGTIKATASNLHKGSLPCGCSCGYKYNERQYMLIIKRLCKEIGYIFNGWAGTFKAGDTILDLYNPLTGNRWKTTSIQGLKRGRRDPHLSNRGLSDSFHIEEFFNTGSYHQETTFTRIPKLKRGMWEVTCGICKEVYQSRMENLKGGQLGCSCTPRLGFDRTKPALIYVNVFHKHDTPITIKYGISNKDVSVRRKSQERSSGLEGETVFVYKNGSGKVISELENSIGKIIKLPRVSKEEMPDGFTESVYYKPYVEKFIINYLEMLIQNLDK